MFWIVSETLNSCHSVRTVNQPSLSENIRYTNCVVTWTIISSSFQWRYNVNSEIVLRTISFSNTDLQNLSENFPMQVSQISFYYNMFIHLKQKQTKI